MVVAHGEDALLVRGEELIEGSLSSREELEYLLYLSIEVEAETSVLLLNL